MRMNADYAITDLDVVGDKLAPLYLLTDTHCLWISSFKICGIIA